MESWSILCSEKMWAKTKWYNGVRAFSGDGGKLVGTEMLDLYTHEGWIENGGALRRVIGIKEGLGPGNTPE